MSKIKEQDILKLLRGKASPKKLKALEEWSSESTENARALEKYQRLYDESDHLSSYKRVDASSEWKNFTSKIQDSVSDNELLEYFDGLASPAERKKVENWKSLSSENEKEFKIFNLILTEADKIGDYKKVDIDSEWSSFDQIINKKESTTPVFTTPAQTIQDKVNLRPISSSAPELEKPVIAHSAKEVPMITRNEESSNRISMWRPLAIAASILLLSIFGWSLWQNSLNDNALQQDQFLTYSTGATPEILTVSDGSVITLNEYTTLTYFKDVSKTEERSVTIDGTGEFDVASDPQKPFIVKASRSGVGIRVLGTKFRFTDHEEYIEVIENIEGSVRAYSLSDTSTYIIMTAGDKFGFDGVKFVDIKDIPEDYNGKEYDILYVLDYLMEHSGWKVTSAPYSEFNGDAIITVDLEKPYEEILEDLARHEDFEYIKMACEGCYKVTRFKQD